MSHLKKLALKPFVLLRKVYRLFVPSILLYSRNKNYRRNSDYGYYFDRLKIDDKLILYESYHGRNISGNPYAMYNYLINDPEFKNYKHVWVVDNLNNPSIDNISKNANTSFVKIHSKKYLKVLAKAKYLINNTSFGFYFQKKEGQIYINTWHGTPLKTLGKDIKSSDISGHKNIQRNFLHVDYFISPNKFTTEIFLRSLDIHGIFNGSILETGYPRIDLTLKPNQEKIKKKFGISTDKKIILYAPTWRGTSVVRSIDHSEKIIEDVEYLNKVLGNEYQVLTKVHMFDHKHIEEKNMDHLCVPNWLDTNELLSIVDILITDYSSIFFDFLPTKKPIIFYLFDRQDYEKDRGFYFNLNDLPGPICETTDNIVNAIQSLEETEKQYNDKYNVALKQFVDKDDGGATERVVDVIFKNKSSSDNFKIVNNKKKILMYAGGFYNNGITISALNLSKYIDYDKYDLTLIDFGNKNREAVNNIKKLNKNTRVIYRPGAMNVRVQESYRHYFVIRKGLYTNWVKKIAPYNLYKKELKRIIGDTSFDVVIDFGGYNSFWSLLFAISDIPKKAIFLHSDMEAEYNKIVSGKFKHRKNLRLTFSLYNYYDKIVSVAKSTNDINKEKLMHLIDDSEDKMVYVNNAVDYERIYKSIHKEEEVEFNKHSYLVLNQQNEFGTLKFTGAVFPQKDEINFVTVGRLSPEKDHKKLILAFYELIQRNPEKIMKLYIIGGGYLEANLKNLVKTLSIENFVIFTGHLENPYLLMSKCDCFVFSSNYEGQGLVILESLVLNKPIIATDVTGVRSVLKGGLGLLVENSKEGLIYGMEEYLNSKLELPNFNGRKYTKDAMEMFYKKVLE